MWLWFPAGTEILHPSNEPFGNAGFCGRLHRLWGCLQGKAG
jgi:hypothetical protein